MIRKTVAALGLLVVPALVAAQTPPPTPPPGQAAPAAPRKLISPVRGEALVEVTKSDTKLVSGEVVTRIRVKNVSALPIAGFKVEENWYDKTRTAIGGGVYRHPRPLLVNEVIEVVIKTPRKPGMDTNQLQLSHANGTVKPKQVPKLDLTTPTTGN
jgi:hypothetical protein